MDQLISAIFPFSKIHEWKQPPQNHEVENGQLLYRPFQIIRGQTLRLAV